MSHRSLFRTHSMRRKRQKLEAILKNNQNNNNSPRSLSRNSSQESSNSSLFRNRMRRSFSGHGSSEYTSTESMDYSMIMRQTSTPEITYSDYSVGRCYSSSPDELGTPAKGYSTSSSPESTPVARHFPRRSYSLPWRQRSSVSPLPESFISERWRTPSESSSASASSGNTDSYLLCPGYRERHLSNASLSSCEKPISQVRF